MNLRARYETAVRDLAERVAELLRDGVPAETIAREVHAERRRLAVHFKALTPEPYRSRIDERTVRVYGNALGPSIEFLRAQGKSWEAIIESATRPGPPVGLVAEQVLVAEQGLVAEQAGEAGLAHSPAGSGRRGRSGGRDEL